MAGIEVASWRQARDTPVFKLELDSFYGSSSHRFKVAAYSALIEGVCEKGLTASVASYLDAYESVRPNDRGRFQVRTDSATHEKITGLFRKYTKIIEVQYFLALCVGLEHELGSPVKVM
jgi:hypothetical protein